MNTDMSVFIVALQFHIVAQTPGENDKTLIYKRKLFIINLNTSTRNWTSCRLTSCRLSVHIGCN